MLYPKSALKILIAGLVLAVLSPAFTASNAEAEIFYCKSTRGPSGGSKYCNFLLFDENFRRHRQVIVAHGAVREIDIGGRYDVFCVLVQNHTGVPNNIAYRKQQCRKTDTGREYKVPIRALNMRRGRNGFSTDAVNGLLPADRW